MLKRLILAAALAAGFSSLAAPASAQVADVVQVCGPSSGVVTAVGPGGHLTRDQYGNLCVNVATAPSTDGGSAIAPTSGGTQTAYVAKNSGGNLYGFSVTMGTTAGYLAILNSATAPAASAAIAPLECVAVPANGYVARRQDVPDRYGTGITAVLSSSCTTYTAVTPQVSTLLVQ